MELVSGKRIKGGKLEKNRFECRDRRGCLKIEFLKNSLVFMAQKTKNTRFLRHFYNFYVSVKPITDLRKALQCETILPYSSG